MREVGENVDRGAVRRRGGSVGGSVFGVSVGESGSRAGEGRCLVGSNGFGGSSGGGVGCGEAVRSA